MAKQLTDQQIQRKLNQICKLSKELHDEAVRRYGNSGNLFLESEGGLYLMSGNSLGHSSERQKFIEFSAYMCWIGAGAW